MFETRRVITFPGSAPERLACSACSWRHTPPSYEVEPFDLREDVLAAFHQHNCADHLPHGVAATRSSQRLSTLQQPAR